MKTTQIDEDGGGVGKLSMEMIITLFDWAVVPQPVASPNVTDATYLKA